MTISTKPATDLYRLGWDRIWAKPERVPPRQRCAGCLGYPKRIFDGDHVWTCPDCGGSGRAVSEEETTNG